MKNIEEVVGRYTCDKVYDPATNVHIIDNSYGNTSEITWMFHTNPSISDSIDYHYDLIRLLRDKHNALE